MQKTQIHSFFVCVVYVEFLRLFFDKKTNTLFLYLMYKNGNNLSLVNFQTKTIVEFLNKKMF